MEVVGGLGETSEGIKKDVVEDPSHGRLCKRPSQQLSPTAAVVGSIDGARVLNSKWSSNS